MARGWMGKLFGDFGHAVRMVVIGLAAAGLGTWGYNKFIKDPIGTISDYKSLRAEHNQLQSNFDAYRATEKERWIRRQATDKERDDQVNNLKIDVSWLKGRVR